MLRFPRAVVLLLALQLACGNKQVVVPLAPQSVSPQPTASQPPAAAPAVPRKPAPAAAASPQPGVPVQAPAQAPQLGDIVTPAAQRQYNAAIDQSLARAQASLSAIAKRQLTKDQQGLVEQIRNFMQQARATRNSDLPGAKSLAQRAEVLAKDLAGSFR